MKYLTMALAATITVTFFAIPAQARHHHHYRHQQRLMHVDQYPAMAYPAYQPPQQKSHRWSRKFADATFARYADGNIEYDSGRIVNHPAGCPGRAFCGCGVSVRVFGHPVRDLFRAANWYRFPRTAAAPGMVAVRNHHVMYIQSVDANGNATVYDPNSGGHQTRVHTRSLDGYAIVNPHGGRTRYASR